MYVESPKALPSKAIEQRAVMKFLAQLEAAYKYQLALKRAQRPKRKLPPVPKFEDSETHSEVQKKVHKVTENGPQINAFSKSPIIIIDESDDKCIDADAFSQLEEEKSLEQEKSDEKTIVISQMNQMFALNEKKNNEIRQETQYSEVNDKKDLRKFKKLEKCLVALIKKLGIKDASVPMYCKEYLELVVPQLTEHFNKKPFIAVAAAILIVACYKAQYPITTKQILEASESKESLVIKCFYSIKEILTKRA